MENHSQAFIPLDETENEDLLCGGNGELFRVGHKEGGEQGWYKGNGDSRRRLYQ